MSQDPDLVYLSSDLTREATACKKLIKKLCLNENISCTEVNMANLLGVTDTGGL